MTMHSVSNHTHSAADKSDHLHFTATVDDAYCCHLWVLIASIKAVCDCTFSFHIVSPQLTTENQQYLLALADHQCEVIFYTLNEKQMQSLHRLPLSERYAKRISTATYLRLFLPQILPENLEHVVYLDCDMLAVNSLCELQNVSLGNATTGVIEDSSLQAQHWAQKLGLADSRYFNAGFMIINLARWRDLQLGEKALALLCGDRTFEYNDQDVLNIILCGQLHYLSGEYNVQSFDVHRWQVHEARIVHFTGAEKPWHISSNHPCYACYWALRNSGPYKSSPVVHLDEHDKALIALLKQQPLSGSKIIICGAGHKGRRLYHGISSFAELTVCGFIDRDASGTYENVPISKNIAGLPSADFYLVASKAFSSAIAEGLLTQGVAENQILAVE